MTQESGISAFRGDSMVYGGVCKPAKTVIKKGLIKRK